jgi:hypothetical protein
VSFPAILAVVVWLGGAVAIRVVAARKLARRSGQTVARSSVSTWYGERVLGMSALAIWGAWNALGILAVALAVLYFPG